MFSSPPPGRGGFDEVVPGLIKIKFFVSVQVRSFLSDVDGLKNFSEEVPRLLFRLSFIFIRLKEYLKGFYSDSKLQLPDV